MHCVIALSFKPDQSFPGPRSACPDCRAPLRAVLRLHPAALDTTQRACCEQVTLSSGRYDAEVQKDGSSEVHRACNPRGSKNMGIRGGFLSAASGSKAALGFLEFEVLMAVFLAAALPVMYWRRRKLKQASMY